VKGAAVWTAAVALLLTSPASAEPVAEYPSLVPTFTQLCLADGVDAAAQAARVSSAPGWQVDARVTVDIPQMEISRAIEHNYSFKKVISSQQWSGTVNGAPARLVLATFPDNQRYKHMCALVIDNVENALPYGGDLRTAFKTFGIGAKSVDLVHYYEFAGKVGPDKHPVRGEIFTRSKGGLGPKSTHIYVAY
jgi:hypothetical protein